MKQGYMKVKEAAKKWDLSERRVRILCKEGKVEGGIRDGYPYGIPKQAMKPVDGRTLKGKIIPKEYQAAFARVELKNKERRDGARLKGRKMERWKRQFCIDFIYHANAMEGNTMTKEETMRVLEDTVIEGKSLQEHLEIVGQKKALEYLEEQLENRHIEDRWRSRKKIQGAEKQNWEKITPCERLLREIHSLIILDQKEDRNVYGIIPLKYKDSGTEVCKAYTISFEIEKLLHQYAKDKRKMHILEAAARLYMGFVSIQPFQKGTEKTGRFLLNLELMKANYLPICIKVEDKKEYQKALRVYHAENNATSMVLLLTHYMETELDHYLELQQN